MDLKCCSAYFFSASAITRADTCEHVAAATLSASTGYIDASSCETRRTLCTRGVIGGGREGNLELPRAPGVDCGNAFVSIAGFASGGAVFAPGSAMLADRGNGKVGGEGRQKDAVSVHGMLRTWLHANLLRFPLV